jgi:RimJ/RimL family protein N-acetyltransferase
MGLRETLGDLVLVTFGDAESRRFGVTVINVVVGAGVDESEALATLKAHHWDRNVHYHVRCNISHREILAFLQGSDKHQVFVADPLSYWQIKFNNANTVANHAPGSELFLKELGPNDLESLAASVRRIFEGYITHWHYTPKTKHLRAEEAYAEWMSSALKGADLKIYEYQENSPSGILAAKIDNDYTDILLAGVFREAQGTGAYNRMLNRFLLLAQSFGQGAVNISTQSGNIRAQRVWASLGFKPLQSTAVVHLAPWSI